MSICKCGGGCAEETSAGVARRNPYDSSSFTRDNVASRCRHPKLIKYYTDAHDVDEDKMTIVEYSGQWDHGNGNGIAYRGMNGIPVDSGGNVASSDIVKCSIYG